jgi:hypothetical protein
VPVTRVTTGDWVISGVEVACTAGTLGTAAHCDACITVQFGPGARWVGSGEPAGLAVGSGDPGRSVNLCVQRNYYKEHSADSADPVRNL